MPWNPERPGYKLRIVAPSRHGVQVLAGLIEAARFITGRILGGSKSISLATATAVARELGRNRSNLAVLLTRDPRFVRVRKDGKKVLYGLKAQATHG